MLSCLRADEATAKDWGLSPTLELMLKKACAASLVKAAIVEGEQQDSLKRIVLGWFADAAAALEPAFFAHGCVQAFLLFL